jgi:hypothetical protein
MTDFQEKKTSDSKDTRTINIEIPANCFEGMTGMMAGRSEKNRAGSGCCEMSRDRCCPPSGGDNKQEIKIVIKKKEQ